jgi:hypothetical protein
MTAFSVNLASLLNHHPLGAGIMLSRVIIVMPMCRHVEMKQMDWGIGMLRPPEWSMKDKK